MTELKMQPANILLVEDDLGDQKLVKFSIESQRIANKLHITNNAEEAMEFLTKKGKYKKETSMPDIILLDLNMPGMGGKEFLKRIKSDNNLKNIPVIILTTSDSEEDIIDTYNLHASGYIKKPVDIDEFAKTMEKLGDYWFMICKLPPKQ
ncbi:MAG: response regulator [Candidatus Nanohalarchaeota archaeon]|nr:MAG: response regulator [Candidatus Nanohaloarchaeota archaeon]